MAVKLVYFAVIADRRSGSMMLQETLNQHSQIHCSGEMFNSFAAEDGCIHNETGYAATVGKFWNWRRAEHLPEIKAIGTLIHRWQAELFPGLWELTGGLHSRFICIYRQNLLRQFLSELIAMQTGIWSCDPANVKGLAKVHIDPTTLALYIDTRRVERSNDWRFQPRIEWPLEKLVQDWESISTRLQHYLRVDPQPLPLTSQRQETRAIRKIVSNYSEVVETVTRLGNPDWLE